MSKICKEHFISCYLKWVNPMLPLKDNIRSKSFPIVTIGLIVINVAIFFYQVMLPPELSRALVSGFGFIPRRLVEMELSFIPLPFYPLVTFFTSAFFHGNFIHLAGNMLYLWVFGDNVEDKLGSGKFILFYLVAAAGGSMGHLLSNPVSLQPAIGASGAVAGILGAYLIFFPHARVLTLVPIGIIITFIHIPAVIFLGVWILLQFLNAGLQDPDTAVSVAWWAHISGFFLGVLYAITKRVK